MRLSLPPSGGVLCGIAQKGERVCYQAQTHQKHSFKINCGYKVLGHFFQEVG